MFDWVMNQIMKNKIMEILRGLMVCGGVTDTEKEIITENWLLDFFRQLPYFQKYPERCGRFPIPGDPLRRSTVWALVKPGGGGCGRNTAEGNDTAVKNGGGGTPEINATVPTVIFMGHHDVVSADVYGEAAPWAFDPDAITKHLNEENLSPEAYTDLITGEWIFGRGSCDMLGGTAVQMAVLSEQAEAVLKDEEEAKEKQQRSVAVNLTGTFVTEEEKSPREDLAETEESNNTQHHGALLFISVPDEESFSVGMRGTLPLLEQLKEQHGLDYRLAVCAEPNNRLPDGRTQVVHSGSIGKLLPVVLVQGKVVQIGSYRDGVNPLGILSRIVAETEGDESFTETCEGERSVPPVWMYVRDLKEEYDFSLSRRAAGYCNVLTFRKTPAQVMAYFLGKIKTAVAETSQPVAVMTWVTLWQQAKQRKGFLEFWKETEEMQKKMLREQHKTFPEVTLWLMERTLDFLHADQPLVVFGFAPPYYPAVRSEEMKNADRFAIYKKALAALQKIKTEPYFQGVSDCSYCGLTEEAQSPAYQANTPLWGKDYRFDMEALVRLQIPFFLLGPWGKDLHQIGERVNCSSLTEEYPEVLRKLLRFVWLSK